MPFLSEFDPRQLIDREVAELDPHELFLGQGAMQLQVAVFAAAAEPRAAALKSAHDARKGKSAAPVVVVALWGKDRAAICSHLGFEHIVHSDRDRGQVERLCADALRAPDRHAATRLLTVKFEQLTAPIPGLRNSGLFAMHELEYGVPRRSDWAEASKRARPLLALRGRPLIERLGFRIEGRPGHESVLVAKGTKVAVALFLERADQIEPASPLFDQLSPVSYALAKADHENLDYVVILAGSTLRVYPVKPGVGTGRRGRTETYVELDLALLGNAHAGYLDLVVSANALAVEGTFGSVLAASRDYAVELGERLRDRVYSEVVPALAEALFRARKLRKPTAEQLAETYEMALLVLFRLLFVAYAEDKELLPLHSSASYRKNSLKEMAHELNRERGEKVEYGANENYWSRVTQVWQAVDKGNPAWHVPAYNGGLFAADHTPGSEALAKVRLADREFAPALATLVLDQPTKTGDDASAPIDFRTLGVREFGTIYEGLLEQELAVAETDLTLDSRDAYVPAKRGSAVVVREGAVYLHDASGARKATGAYYTKDFAVEHLLDHALEPALTDHLARIAARYDEREASAKFFEFHVADIAMGSGHFLVAAIDHIERRLSGYMASRRLPGVIDELERLRKSAAEALGDDYRGDLIEDTQLLRRQIARRCVFGVDLNPLAVELARLSIWIHTFVPGLPLSFLDQNLVVGNSLVGVGTIDEARQLLGAEAGDLFSTSAATMLDAARAPLERLARLTEATAAEVKQARKLHGEARAAIRDKDELFTILAASRIDTREPGDNDRQRAARLATVVESGQLSTRGSRDGDVFTQGLVRRAEQVLKGIRVLHFPIAFPQVFMGERGGFDVILGNPPWEEATVEEDAFWARHNPGLRGLSQREQEVLKEKLRRDRPDLAGELDTTTEQAAAVRRLLVTGPFPGMGTGDPDLYKAFSWRFWSLVSANGGRIGVVLPRSAFAAAGSTEFRRALFAKAASLELTQLLNNQQWVFAEVHPQYTIALVAITRGARQEQNIALDGPYASLRDYRAGRVAERLRFDGTEPAKWNDTLSLPLLPTHESLDVMRKLRRSPRLDLDDGRSWRARPHTELHATNDKDLMDLKSEKRPRGYWPVFKGESFDTWTPDTGTYYGWAEPKPLLDHLQAKRERSARRAESPFAGFDAEWLSDIETLPCNSARVVFRDVTRSTDSRTMRAALVPPKVSLTNKAPFFLWPRGDVRDQAFLLGVLSSIPLDWYARRFVETTMNFFIMNPFPIPRPPQGSAVRDRVIAISARLASPDDRFEEWASGCGIEPALVEEDEKEELIAELDASVARLYGLGVKDVRHIFETFHTGWDYEARLRRVLYWFERTRD
jgi:hypothetical protein